MEFLPFPTAVEMKYRWNLIDILSRMKDAHQNFIDVILGNKEIIKYLTDKGYTVVELRYEYNEDRSEFGFFGRTSGDGVVITRIIWGDVNFCMKQFGDFSQ